MAAVVAFCLTAYVQAAQKAEPAGNQKVSTRQTSVRISKETTFVTEPLDAAGYVDYVEALNRECSQGVTPENNFEVAVRRVLGVDGIEQALRAEYLRRLGIAEADPSFSKIRFLRFQSFLDARVKSADPADRRSEQARAARDLSAEPRPWSRRDQPLIADWLDENAAALDAIAEGSRRTKCYMPYLVSPDDDETAPPLWKIAVPYLEERRELAWAFAARSMRRLAAGDAAGCWSDLQVVHRIARHTAAGALDFDALVARSIEIIACKGDIALCEFSPSDSNRLKTYETALRNLPTIAPMARCIDQYERIRFLDAAEFVAREGRPGGRLSKLDLSALTNPTKSVDWNAVMLWGNGQFDRYRRILAINDPLKQRRSWQEMETDFWREQKQPGTINNRLYRLYGPIRWGNGATAVLGLALRPPVFEAMQTAQPRSDAWLRLARLAFLLTAYRIEHRQSPDRLDKLAPNYLARVPADPFTGGQFVYRAQSDGFLVYSLGPNGKDDSGRSEGPVPKTGLPADDIAIRLFVLLK
jgi:hypothetical protein